jgi:ferritin-like metal-binding protein YciE
MEDMTELMLHFLQDIYYAEKLGVRAMAKVIRAVENEELKDALMHHREQSQHQVERLSEVFAALGKKPRAKTCAAMDGLVEECNEAIQEGDKGPVLDAALIACQQAAEHYEIARYGAMAAWAHSLGLDDAAAILEDILQEEKEADEHLTEIAQRVLNPEALEEGEDEEDEEEEEDEGEEVQEVPEPAPARRRSPSRAKVKA